MAAPKSRPRTAASGGASGGGAPRHGPARRGAPAGGTSAGGASGSGASGRGASGGRASGSGASGSGASGGAVPGGPARRGGAPRGGASRGGRGRRADPVRRLAYDVLIAVEQRDAYANLLLPSMLAERGLAGRDAALATELTYGTLRARGSYDAILSLCSDRSLDRVDPRCARYCASAPTSSWPPGWPRTRLSRPPWTSPGTWPASARRASSTRCCAGCPPATWKRGSGLPRRAATPIRSVTWPSGTAIPGGW